MKISNPILVTASVAGLCFSLCAPAAQVRGGMLVTTDWLAGHLNDPKVVVLQVSRDKAAYDAGHVPGARFVAFNDIVVAREGIPNELPPAGDLKRVFEQAGVSDDSHVVIYTDGNLLPATRAWFTIDYLGHGDAASLLDGGLAKWKAENRSLSKDAPTVSAGHFTPKPRPETVANIDAVKDLSWAAVNNGSGGTMLLDARPAEDFSGSRPNAELKQFGHIPGAVNVVATATQGKDGAFLPEGELRKIYEAVGVTPDKPVVTYCNSGMQASQAYFALKYLGYDTKLYDGSLSEWTAKGVPVQK